MRADIEAYLNGELQGAALEEFEAELALNSALQEEVELLRPTVRVLKRAAIALRVEEASRNRVARRRTRRIVVLSCSVLLGVGGLWWWWKHPSEADVKQEYVAPPQQQPEKDTMPATAVKPSEKPIAKGPEKTDPTAPIYRSFPKEQALPPDGVVLADSFLRGFDAVQFINMAGLNAAWRKKDYQGYYNTLERIMADKGKDDTALLLQSACLLLEHRPKAAETELYRLRKINGRVGQEAQWLLALGYVMQGKDDSARAAMEGIARVDGPHREEARRMLPLLEQ